MTFSELLIVAMRRCEIPLRFEPGAEEAMASTVSEVVRAWVESHDPATPATDFAYGQRSVIRELIEELDGTRPLPE